MPFQPMLFNFVTLKMRGLCEFFVPIRCTDKMSYLGHFIGTRVHWLTDTFNRTAGIPQLGV
jgi:hypothetical protein